MPLKKENKPNPLKSNGFIYHIVGEIRVFKSLKGYLSDSERKSMTGV